SLSATATDDVAVAGVQFKLDGNDLGSEDTTAPYEFNWDASDVSAGSHTLTAVARDTSGNAQTSAPVTVTVDPTGMVAAYGFEETTGTAATDRSGKGNGGTLNGPTRTTGKFGSALSFDGVNDWVTVPASASLDLSTAMTLEAWIRPSGLGGWRTVLMREDASFYTYGIYADTSTGRPSGNAVVGGEDIDVRASSAVPTDAWTHLAATYDGTAVRLFVNGVQAAQLPAAGAIASAAGPLHIGGNGIWPEWFVGLIDEVRIYNRSLTATEIQSDMTRPVTSTDATPPSAPGTLSATGGLGTVSLSWGAATDGGGVARYNVHRSTTAGFTPSAANRVAQPTGTSYADAGLAPGTYYYRVTAEDAAGNVGPPSNQASAAATADTTAPTVSVTAPSTGATVSGSISVTASAADAGGVAGVQFKLDGANLGSEDTAAPYGVTWDTSATGNGSHSLTATARDATGNQATSSPVTVTVSNVAPSGLVAAYGFGEGSGTTTADSSGNGNAGTISGASWSTAGHAGNALSFDGANDWVTVPDANSLDLTTGMTLEAWVFPTAAGGVWRTVALKEQPGNLVYGIYANRETNRPMAEISVAGAGRGVDGVGALPLNAWSHLAATYDGAFLRLFVNGTQAAQLAQTGPIATSSGVLRLGGNAVWGEWFAGRLDDVRVYNRALTAAQIQADMNQPVGGTPPPTNTPPNVTITAPATGTTWKVDDPITFGATATDAQDGTLAGTAFDWTVLIQHCPSNCHTHTYRTFTDTASGSFPAPDHEYPSYVQVSVTATDSGGLSTTVTRDIQPQTVALTFASTPPGLQLTVGAAAQTTPFTRTVIVGSANSVSADTPQSLGGTSYTFSSWSDGGAQSHLVTAPAAATTYTAAYAAAGAPPTVSVTAPSAGATVTGSTAVSATASDADGIAGVRFTLDGNALGAEDTTSPYGITWDTTTASNGSHVLRAIARDATGAETTSAGVTVTVSNGATPPAGLVAAYGFEETTGSSVTDSSGTGNNGTITGAARSTQGKNGRALSFDGVNDWVTVPDAASLDLTSGMTLEAWVFPTALGSVWRTVLFKEQPGNLVYGLYANRVPPGPNGQVFVAGADRNANGTTALPLNAWTHLAVSYDTAVLRLFVNGAQVAQVAQAGPISTSTGVLHIGGNSVWAEWFAGRLDDVRIYNRALTAAEIQGDMNRAATAPAQLVPSAVATGAGGAVVALALAWFAVSRRRRTATGEARRSTPME
ncbi:MAG TPA: LamG-like jellyroll fold domain-containing protein, partial [Gaiellaceae bacterium]|nr:LamG-like jellyroll fold domain-containing protein [Gaiellaceae bacterium]